MLEIYERVPKESSNPYGIKKIEKVKEEPFLLCISAQDRFPKSVFGLIREGMQAARVRTSQEDGPGYDVSNFPVHFLGMSYQLEQNRRSAGEALAEEVFIPLLGEEKKDLLEVERKMRNINIMTYCDGTRTYMEAEKKLEEYMKEKQYSEEEISLILSQISVTAIATMQDTSSLKATTMSFLDINDPEVMTMATTKLKEHLDQTPYEASLLPFSENSGLYYFEGTGEHSIKEYLKDESKGKIPLEMMICSSLNNSIHNQKTSNFVPLKYKSISSTLTEFLPYQTTKSKEELKRAFDQELEYEGAKKISPLEMKLYNEIDKLCKNNLFLEREKTWTKNELDRINNRYGKLIDVVKELAPEDLAEEILVKGADYQGRLGKK